MEETNITALGIALTAIMMLLMLVLPRAYAFIPILLTAFWMTLGQRIVIATLNFQMLRLVVFAAYIRILLRGEYRNLQFRPFDRRVLLWVSCSCLVYILLFADGAAVINRGGLLFDTLGIYFMFRISIQDVSDARRIVLVVAWALVPVALLMANERLTGINAFYLLGGVSEYAFVRDGVVRAQGPFTHPILAGTVGAVWFAAFAALWMQRYRLTALVGMTAAMTIVICSGSSGPLLGCAISLLALGMWTIRSYMRLVRWAVIAGLVGLQLLMKEPIWFIFAKINIVSGSTGWHRSHLMDQAVRHWSEWVLTGIKEVESWGVWKGDVTNHYLLEGFRGGAITMIIFIQLIVLAYKYIGKGVRLWPRREDQWLIWSLGAMLTAHVVTFFSVAYYDLQMMTGWYAMIAMAAMLYVPRWQQQQQQQQALPEGANSQGWNNDPHHPVWWAEEQQQQQQQRARETDMAPVGKDDR